MHAPEACRSEVAMATSALKRKTAETNDNPAQVIQAITSSIDPVVRPDSVYEANSQTSSQARPKGTIAQRSSYSTPDFLRGIQHCSFNSYIVFYFYIVTFLRF